MPDNKTDRQIVRDLAKRVADIAAMPLQAQRSRLWKACNDLKPKRAMVLATQQPQKEMERAWLRMECQDPMHRPYEHALRQVILHHERIPDDFPILGEFKVHIPITGDDLDDYGAPVKTPKDLDRLHFRPIRIDHAAADRQVEEAQELLGDILSVRKVGKTLWHYGLSRALVHLRGPEQIMLDMYDNPELVHRLMAFLRDDSLREIDLFEKEKALTFNNRADNINGSGGLSLTADLPGKSNRAAAKAKNCLCWGESQEIVGASPEQFDEFILQYQLPLMRRFGLTDYGCCESLDQKLDLLMAKIPNLRWVSVSPWADRQVCADKIGKNYVYVYKPNPSRICSPRPDWGAAEKEIRQTLEIARGCAVHLCMKDTITFCNEPQRTTKWCEMALRVAKEMA